MRSLIKSGSYVLNYQRNIFSLFQIFDACVQTEKVLVYYLICYVEVDGLRNKTKYESSRSPEQWFTKFFGFTQKPTTTNITTTGMLKCIKKFAWIVCISNKKILTHELTVFSISEYTFNMLWCQTFESCYVNSRIHIINIIIIENRLHWNKGINKKHWRKLKKVRSLRHEWSLNYQLVSVVGVFFFCNCAYISSKSVQM